MAKKKEEMRGSLTSLTVAQLKEQLRERSLPVSGNKPDLIQRLLDDDAAAESKVEAETIEPGTEVAGSEPSKVAEIPCEDCGKPFVPAKPEYKHCKDCHAKWQFEQRFKPVKTELEGLKKAFGRYHNYKPAEILLEEAEAYYIAGNFVAAAAALGEALDKAKEIVARGSLKYARRLLGEVGEYGLSADEEIGDLADRIEAALSKGKPRQAARLARELRDALRLFSRELRSRKERAAFVRGGRPVGEIIHAKDPATYQALEERRREG